MGLESDFYDASDAHGVKYADGASNVTAIENEQPEYTPELEEIIKASNDQYAVVSLHISGGEDDIQRTYEDVILKFVRYGDYVQIDFEEGDSADGSTDKRDRKNLKSLWNALTMYGNFSDAVAGTEDAGTVGALFTIAPEPLAGEIVFLAENPVVWALTANSFDEQVNTFRIVFYIDDVGIYSTSEEEDAPFSEHEDLEASGVTFVDTGANTAGESVYEDDTEEEEESEETYSEEQFERTKELYATYGKG